MARLARQWADFFFPELLRAGLFLDGKNLFFLNEREYR